MPYSKGRCLRYRSIEIREPVLSSDVCQLQYHYVLGSGCSLGSSFELVPLGLSARFCV